MTDFLSVFSAILQSARRIIPLIFLLFMAACATPDAAKPMSFVFTHMPEDAPIEYKQGWQDGCQSGLAAVGNDYYKTFYKFTQSPEMISNAFYYRGWFSAYHYCRGYVYATLKEGGLRSTRPEAPKERVLGEEGGVFGRWGPSLLDNW